MAIYIDEKNLKQLVKIFYYYDIERTQAIMKSLLKTVFTMNSLINHNKNMIVFTVENVT